MKLAAGVMLFCLCSLIGEQKRRGLLGRVRALEAYMALIRRITETQARELIPFFQAALRCPPSEEREALLQLARGETAPCPALTTEEREALSAFARREHRSLGDLRRETDALLAALEAAHERAKADYDQKGRVYGAIGYLSGLAVLLLVV